jgi:Tol biopolymer transport system component
MDHRDLRPVLVRSLIFSFVILPALFVSAACAAGTPTRAVTPTTSLRVVVPTVAPASPTVPGGGTTASPTAPGVSVAISPTRPSLPLTATLSSLPTATTAVSATKTVVKATPKPSATAAKTTPTVVAKPAGLSGRIAYSVATDPAPQLHSIWIAKGDGSSPSKILDGAAWPALSPDGKSIAYLQLAFAGRLPGLFVADSYGGNPVAVPDTANPGLCCINWSRDGGWIVYAVSQNPKQPGGPISMVKVDSTFKTKISLGVFGNSPAFSPDGKQIVYSGSMPGVNSLGLLAVGTDGTASPRPITSDNGGNAQWSPRGDKIVYQATDASGNIQVFVVNPDGTGKKQLTSGKGNDGQPIWSRDGGSIYWRSDQNRTAWAIMVMNADGSNPRRLVSDVPPDQDLWGWEALSVSQ